jgi:hypothetical protein
MGGLRRLGNRRTRAPRSATPEVTALENRELLASFLNFGKPKPAPAFIPPPVVGVEVQPNTLFPPNGKYVPVTVLGTVSDPSKTPPTASFQVTDEYRRDQPRGPVQLHRVGKGKYWFRFNINLQAQRAEEYPAGRRYYVVVGAGNMGGFGGQTVAVQVPLSLRDRGQPPQKLVKGTKLPPVNPPARTQNTFFQNILQNPLNFLNGLSPGRKKK